jgi:hypothetical protein
MIAYTVLMEPEFAKHDIRLFVTLGSPLGIDEVQDFLKDHTGQTKLAVPPNVKRWINVCDPLDPVALDKTVRSDFRKNAHGVEAEDELEFNPDSPRHPHSGTGYLSLAKVRQPVRQAVDTALFQPVARFKIAKDVVRALTDSQPDDRHRVLVQLEDFATTEMNRKDALKRIYEILQAADDSPMRELLAPEELHRYVALNLTRQQAEMLSAQSMSDRKSPVARIWKNSAKWAMLDRSIHTTQAFPAHNSYKAAGADVTWAVLDSGIHLDHPHFSNKTILRAYDCTDPKQRRNGDRMLEPLDLKSDAGKEGSGGQFRPRRARRGHHRGDVDVEGRGREGACHVRHGARREARHLQGPRRQRLGRGLVDHQGTRRHLPGQRERRPRRDPRREPQPGRRVRRGGVQLRTHAAVRRAAAVVASGCGGGARCGQ